MARRKKYSEPRCTWTYSGDFESAWDSDCGEKWQFTEGGPKENGCRYCHGCGRPLKIEVKKG